MPRQEFRFVIICQKREVITVKSSKNYKKIKADFGQKGNEKGEKYDRSYKAK